MAQVPDLGTALAQLRRILGLSLYDCATQIGVAVERLDASEQGDIDGDTLERLAALYALDAAELQRGMIMPLAGVEGSTVFLLHGPYQDFDAHDLGVLDRAMRAARAVTALSAAQGEGARLARRVQFTPTQPAGPRPKDAAQQGYKLARYVRAKLGLQGEPIKDIGELVEEQLGVAVVVDDLVSDNLRAASILDARRAAAAIVLAAEDLDRAKNPVLARVYLAHELCHLLFDPGAANSVRLALDDRLNDGAGSRGGASTTNSLLERRAKGFAAEFLIPLEGVRRLLGATTATTRALSSARQMVIDVREHFGTPWEIATRHLINLGFIEPSLTSDLLHRPEPPRAHYPTALPAPSAPPALLKRLAPTRYERMPLAIDEPPHEPPPHVVAARQAAEATLDQLSRRVVERALAVRDRKIEATSLVVDHFDELLLAGEFGAVCRALAMVDAQVLPPKVLTGVLMVTRPAREQLGDARTTFFERVRAALAETWQVSSDDIDAIVRRLR